MAPPFVPTKLFYASSETYHIYKERKGHYQEKLTKVEYAISHNHLISLYVHTYVFH